MSEPEFNKSTWNKAWLIDVEILSDNGELDTGTMNFKTKEEAENIKIGHRFKK